MGEAQLPQREVQGLLQVPCSMTPRPSIQEEQVSDQEAATLWELSFLGQHDVSADAVCDRLRPALIFQGEWKSRAAVQLLLFSVTSSLRHLGLSRAMK